MSRRISEPEPLPLRPTVERSPLKAPAPGTAPGTGGFRTPVGAVVRRARLNPLSLTPGDVVQLQRAIGNAAVGRLLGGVRPSRPPTGLPAGLKRDIEARSGLEMDDVRVHRDSQEPARVDALAFARGTDIHLGPGQEQHLPHEAWHVVQQKQGRVRATGSVAGLPVNEDPALESEASWPPSRPPAALAPGGPDEAAAPRVLQKLSYSNPGMNGNATVAANGGRLVLTGGSSIGQPPVQTIYSGEVTPMEYRYSQGRAVRAGDGVVANARRLNNIASNPQGVGLGLILAFEVAHLAVSEGKEWVIAMTATGQGQGFYNHLGFQQNFDPNVPRNQARALMLSATDPATQPDQVQDMIDRSEALMRTAADEHVFYIASGNLFQTCLQRIMNRGWQVV